MEKVRRMNLSILFTLTCILTIPLCWRAIAAETAKVVLEGDRVVYEQNQDIASAEGNVKLRYEDLRVYADRIVYKTMGNIVEAFSGESGQLTLLQGAKELRGSRLSLDLVSGEGKVFEAQGEYPAEEGHVYAEGDTVETIKVSGLEESRWLGSPVSEDAIAGDHVYRWENASVTSCSQKPPHYSLVSRQIVVLPGYRVIVRKPKVYLKEHMLFPYPFDYIISLRGKGDASPLVPAMLHDSERGIGAAWGSRFGTGAFTVLWKAIYWSNVDFEGFLSLEYALSEHLKVYANQEYSWDSESKDKRYRPMWGATYSAKGWDSRLEWSQAESVTVEKDLGDTFEGVLWKSPELTIHSPAYALPGDVGSVSFTGVWGSYETRAFDGNDEVSVARIAFLADMEGSTALGDLRPFWGARYWHHRYDDPSVTQERTGVWIGVEWPLGDIDMVSRWSRNWVDGRSPMDWDRYSDSKAFYQTLGLSLTERCRFSARGGYNLDTDELDEMFYRLVYDNNCCYNVQLRFRDDRTATNDDWAEIRFVLTAFPNHPFFLGERD